MVICPAPVVSVVSPSLPYFVCSGDQATIELDAPTPTSGWANYIVVNSIGEGVADFYWTTSSTTNPIFNFNPDTTADYTVYVYDGDCVVETEPIPVIVPRMELGENVYLCSGTGFEITDAQVPVYAGATYDWQVSNSTVSISAHPTLSPTVATTYSLTETFSGCTLTDEFTIYPITCCSVPGSTIFTSRVVMDNTDLSTLGTLSTNESTLTLDGKTLSFADGLTVTGRNLELKNCTLYMSQGSDILVDDHFELILRGTKIEPCDTMWEGIILNPAASITTKSTSINRTEINGAQ